MSLNAGILVAGAVSGGTGASKVATSAYGKYITRTAIFSATDNAFKNINNPTNPINHTNS